MWRIVEKVPNALVSWYLMTSWLYYVHDISALPDEDFDQLCVELLKAHPNLTHRHRHFVSPDDLKAGTGYAIKEYPQIVQSAGTRIAIEDKHVRLDKKNHIWVPIT